MNYSESTLDSFLEQEDNASGDSTKVSSVAKHVAGGGALGAGVGLLTGSQVSDGTGIPIPLIGRPDGNYSGTGALLGAAAGMGLGKYTGTLSKALKGSKSQLASAVKRNAEQEKELASVVKREGAMKEELESAVHDANARLIRAQKAERAAQELSNDVEALRMAEAEHLLRRYEAEYLHQYRGAELNAYRDYVRQNLRGGEAFDSRFYNSDKVLTDFVNKDSVLRHDLRMRQKELYDERLIDRLVSKSHYADPSNIGAGQLRTVEEDLAAMPEHVRERILRGWRNERNELGESTYGAYQTFDPATMKLSSHSTTPEVPREYSESTLDMFLKKKSSDSEYSVKESRTMPLGHFFTHNSRKKRRDYVGPGADAYRKYNTRTQKPEYYQTPSRQEYRHPQRAKTAHGKNVVKEAATLSLALGAAGGAIGQTEARRRMERANLDPEIIDDTSSVLGGTARGAGKTLGYSVLGGGLGILGGVALSRLKGAPETSVYDYIPGVEQGDVDPELAGEIEDALGITGDQAKQLAQDLYLGFRGAGVGSLAGTGYGIYRGYKGELEKADKAIRLHGKKSKKAKGK